MTVLVSILPLLLIRLLRFSDSCCTVKPSAASQLLHVCTVKPIAASQGRVLPHVRLEQSIQLRAQVAL